ncbi:hypothetical protein [Hyalangium gracile]|uniref:hypothetical protein n=1 Tax=Hyalangium gracile TaxID=394092 RepID=UPI001CCAF3DF|nr:hypothetical protein [Hyalangium gracile]
MANSRKPPSNTRAEKVYTALGGDDEFSVFSVDPEARKPKVELGLKDNEKAVATPLSRSIVRLFRKIFGE